MEASSERCGGPASRADMTHHAYHALDSHITGFTLWQVSMPFETRRSSSIWREGFLKEIPADRYPYVIEHAEQHIARSSPRRDRVRVRARAHPRRSRAAPGRARLAHRSGAAERGDGGSSPTRRRTPPRVRSRATPSSVSAHPASQASAKTSASSAARSYGNTAARAAPTETESRRSARRRRLGQELGVEAMSLYNHVANKDDMLDGIVESGHERDRGARPTGPTGRRGSVGPRSRPTRSSCATAGRAAS